MLVLGSSNNRASRMKYQISQLSTAQETHPNSAQPTSIVALTMRLWGGKYRLIAQKTDPARGSVSTNLISGRGAPP